MGKKLDKNRHRSTPLCKVIVSGRYEMENNVHVEEQGQGRGSQVPSDGPITMRPVDRRSSPSTRVSHEPSTREEEGVLKTGGWTRRSMLLVSHNHKGVADVSPLGTCQKQWEVCSAHSRSRGELRGCCTMTALGSSVTTDAFRMDHTIVLVRPTAKVVHLDGV